MSKYKVRILPDSTEDLDYDERGIPVWLNIRNLSDYEEMRSYPHWHEELELMYIVSGALDYHVNGRCFRLRTNECILINSSQINYSTSINHQPCTFACFLIHPTLLAANKIIYDRCVAPVINNPDFEYFYFTRKTAFHKEIVGFMKTILAEKSDRQPTYELRLIHHALGFFITFAEYYHLLDDAKSRSDDNTYQLYRSMLSFIHRHYMDKILLQDIADAGNVCRSKCCQIFNEYLHMPPIDFLNQYRLEVGCRMLTDDKLSITDISGFCGFSQPSYFTQCFRRRYGISPSEYRVSGDVSN